MGKIVRFYQTEGGKTPVEHFLDSLPGKVARKVLWVSMVAEELDILLTTYFKKLVGSDDIRECRVQFGSNDYTGFSVSTLAARCWCSLMGL